jgi:energy-coupling factor transporter ATP-binding protein EcfA2
MCMKSMNWETLVYFVFILGLYAFQLYQNINVCAQFYSNMQKINAYLIEMRNYVAYSAASIAAFLAAYRDRPSYAAFLRDAEKNMLTLTKLRAELADITPFSHGISKVNEMGYMLKCYYQLHANQEYEDSIQYSIGFEGYISSMMGVYDNLAAQTVHFAAFDASASVKMSAQYYPPLKNGKYVANDTDLKKNMVITGPNASGKTTLLKTTCINVILTQQFGCGFYTGCVLNPYTHIHSYLNIPDTSGRDSLFQAESRRCKEIIDIVQHSSNASARHFCMFDELYSGTNPREATKSAYSLLSYLAKFRNVNFVLTTHYVGVCKKLKKHPRIRNHKMNVKIDGLGKIKYTYKICKGISRIQGAIGILEDFDYPEEIIRGVKNYVK